MATDALKLEGRLLFLAEEAETVARQLAGEDLSLSAALPLKPVGADEILPGWAAFFFEGRLGDFPYLGLDCGGSWPVGEGALRRGGFVASVSGHRGRGCLRDAAPMAEYAAGLRAVFASSFDPAYLDVPSEVLVTTMKKHQRYFPVRDRSGKLCPFFVGVSNNQATRMQVVREGNERVLRARLADAAFFWQEDQKDGLASRVEGLKSVLYQEKLGSVYQKAERARGLALWLVDALGLQEIRSLTDRAAFLAKADLLTNMVYEFPELQGVMGREYARREGEPERVALALHEQYLPRFASDRLPTDVVGALVGLADRADTLVAIHHVGLEPSGSQDPYGLRRASRCINEILWGLDLDVPVRDLFARAGDPLGAQEETLRKVGDFYRQRTAVQLREKGYGHGVVDLALQCAPDRPLQTLRLLQVLEELKGEPWFASLVTAAVRVRNILAKAPEAGCLEPASLGCEEERGLLQALEEIGPSVRRAVEACDWREVARWLHRLEEPISRFFDGVLVMDPDERVRANRIGLLRRAQELFDAIGDFSYLKNEVKA